MLRRRLAGEPRLYSPEARRCEVPARMRSHFTPSPCVKTTKVFVLSRRRYRQERAVPLPCPHPLRSTLLACLPQASRAPSCHATRSVPHSLEWRESRDRCLFRRHGRASGIEHGRSGVPLRPAAPDRAETRSGAPRQQSCRFRHEEWDGDFALRPRLLHEMLPVARLVESVESSSPKTLMARPRSLVWTVEARNPCTSSRASVMNTAVCSIALSSFSFASIARSGSNSETVWNRSSTPWALWSRVS